MFTERNSLTTMTLLRKSIADLLDESKHRRGTAEASDSTNAPIYNLTAIMSWSVCAILGAGFWVLLYRLAFV